MRFSGTPVVPSTAVAPTEHTSFRSPAKIKIRILPTCHRLLLKASAPKLAEGGPLALAPL